MISNFYKDKNLCFSIYSGAQYLEGEVSENMIVIFLILK
jgi:hypothetical protein